MKELKTKEPLVLKVVDKFIRPFLSKDLNYQMIREVLKFKLLLDKRRIPTINKIKKSDEEPKDRSMVLTYIAYMFLGFFIAATQGIPNVFVANIFSYGILIFTLFSVYINEYSAVLLDITEKPFFGVLPIGKRELGVAKNIHISYYIGMIGLSTILPSVIAACIIRGILYAIIYAIVSILVTLFCLYLAGALYFLLLKAFSGERLKDILSTFQVVMTILIIAAYQIIPRVFNVADIENLDLSFNPFLFIIPSAWFSAIFSIIFDGTLDIYYYALTAIALLSLVLLGVFNRKKISVEFEGVLDKLTETENENKSLSRLLREFCKFFSKDNQEKAFMELVLIQISRDRKLKMKIYPQLANAVIIPLLILFSQIQSGKGIMATLSGLKSTPLYLCIYMVGISSAGIYALICQTDNLDSAMLYRILPIKNLSKCVRAGIKVVLFRYLTPIYIITSAIFLAIYGFKISVDVVVMYMAFLLISSLTIRISCFDLPFVNESKSNLAMGLLTFFINFMVLGGLAFFHFFFLRTLLLKMVAIAVLLFLNLLFWQVAMNKKYKLERA